MATVGVAVTSGIVAVAAVGLFGVSWVNGLAVGAALAPTDAAAVNLLLRRARVALPERVTALLEVESGLNDPMSVFLMVALVPIMIAPARLDTSGTALLLAEEMVGGAAIGVVGGYALLALLRRLSAEAPIFPVLAFFLVMTLFGAAQKLGASGFLAVYLMGLIIGTHPYRDQERLEQFYEAFAWMAQIALFLMLGLLVTPHDLLSTAPAILAIAAVLILVARPVATFACLLPFGFTVQETSFASWVGLRGAVPIFLTIIPVLQGVHDSQRLFGIAFGIVVASLVVQGWTIRHAASLLGFSRRAEAPINEES
jgi:NhaP-type Na+/H+ and K+/H+ antiporter